MLGACSVAEPAGDPFPVHVDLTQGPVLVHVARPGEAPMPATLDVLAPFTLIDPGAGTTSVARQSIELDLYGQRTPGSADVVERARFWPDLVLLHPCDPATPSCTVGAPAAPTAIGAVLGADALGTAAIRFDLANSNVYVFPDIAGADDQRDQQCDARFGSPFRGGGTLVLGGADVNFSGRRIAIGACLSRALACTEQPGTTGADALFVLSTGVGPTILGATAYLRYCRSTGKTASACDADLAGLAPTTVLLPSGAIAGRLGEIEKVALVASPPRNSRGPCSDLRASYCLSTGSCPTLCTETNCGAPATVELPTTAKIAVVVVDDAEPSLQALRAELRPDQPEVDGILGVDALHALQVDVDYPNNRMLIRCGDPAATTCRTRPALGSASTAHPDFDTCTAGKDVMCAQSSAGIP